MRFHRKVAIVTGAKRDIGSAIATRLRAKGLKAAFMECGEAAAKQIGVAVAFTLNTLGHPGILDPCSA